jgi:hypothetical protein
LVWIAMDHCGKAKGQSTKLQHPPLGSVRRNNVTNNELRFLLRETHDLEQCFDGIEPQQRPSLD